MRSLWKGVLSFGLVAIPVRLYAATESRDVRLHYLHAPCAAPVSYRKVCTACGAEVRPEDLALGYQAGPERFVVLEEEDLARLPIGPENAVEIERFVPTGAVDPVFLAKAYYLEPQPGGHKAYRLLHRALVAEGRVAVVRIALRRRERWAVVRAGGEGVLHLETLLDADEVRPAAGVEVGGEVALRAGEVDLARRLVQSLAAEFDPLDNPDRYRQALTALIERKVAAGETRAASAGPESREVIDLMEALRASLGEDAAEDGPAPAATAASEGRRSRGRTGGPVPPAAGAHARAGGRRPV